MDQLPTNGGMLYHEIQESKLCAVHCVNTVLQGPFFSEFDLASLASDLDYKERQVMAPDPIRVSGDYDPDHSHNASFVGDFSIQVLERALEIWDLQVIPLDSPAAEAARVDPGKENAFICHLQDHWFCVRKVNGEWYNFDSLYAAPEHLSSFSLAAHLDTLKGFGWSIFLVRGNFPAQCPLSSSEASNRYGQWLTPEEADTIFKACNQTVLPSGGSNPAPLDQNGVNPFPTNENPVDEDLKAAIATSLVDFSAVTRTGGSHPAPLDQNGVNPSPINEKPVDEDLKAAIAASLVDFSAVTGTEGGSPTERDNSEK